MPYAAKAIVSHDFNVNHVSIWVEFNHAMEMYIRPLASPVPAHLTPALSLWKLKCDGVELAVVAESWQDGWTLLLTSDTIEAAPSKITLEYLGPSIGLKTAWGKQWEAFGPIPSEPDWPTTFSTGMIIIWHGSVASIPSGWHICDGNGGTPNLLNKFIVGAGNTYAPAASGGNLTHTHAATQESHHHSIYSGTGFQFNPQSQYGTAYVAPIITVPSTNHLPPYYALCYIMKL